MQPQANTTTTPKVRRCGTRTPGHAYSVTNITITNTVVHTDPVTKKEREDPLDMFLLCPSIEVDPEMNLSDQGVTTLLRPPGYDLQYDIWDVIGSSFYPYFPIFYEEGKQMGFSRKIQGVQFELLSRESKHLLIHHRGLLEDYDPLFDSRLNLMHCPQGHEWHNKNEKVDFCTALLWEAQDKPDSTGTRDFVWQPDKVQSELFPLYTYETAHWPVGYNPVWHTAIMMILPIHGIEVVEDSIAGTHQKALDLIKNSGTDLPYCLVEE